MLSLGVLVINKSRVYGVHHMMPTFHNGKAMPKACSSPASNAPEACSHPFLHQSGSNFARSLSISVHLYHSYQSLWHSTTRHRFATPRARSQFITQVWPPSIHGRYAKSQRASTPKDFKAVQTLNDKRRHSLSSRITSSLCSPCLKTRNLNFV